MIRLALAAPLLLIAACSSPEGKHDDEVNAAAAEGFEPPTPSNRPPLVTMNAADATKGGDGSRIVLGELEGKDVEGLRGELACAFSEYKSGPSLLIARANVGETESAQAAVRNGGVLERLVSTGQGGFGMLEKGVTFGGKGLVIKIEPQSKLETGNESTATSAQVLVQRADGAERRYQGLWSCGP